LFGDREKSWWRLCRRIVIHYKIACFIGEKILVEDINVFCAVCVILQQANIETSTALQWGGMKRGCKIRSGAAASRIWS
jgi:hypothetical protein